MKHLFVLACTALMSLPALANNFSTSAQPTSLDSYQAELTVRPGYPGRPGPGRPHRPGRDRWVTCAARNTFGQTFTASDRDVRGAQWRAMNRCERSTRYGSCRVVNCWR